MQFPQELITEITVPNNVPFLPGYDVIGIGSQVPKAVSDAGYGAAIMFYSSGYSKFVSSPQIKYQFIAVDNGIIFFGYGYVVDATLSEQESIVIYEAHGYTAQSSQSALDYMTTGYVDADKAAIEDLAVNATLRYQGTELTELLEKGASGTSAGPRGINCFATFTPTLNAVYATETAIGYLDWTALTNRLYKVRTGALANNGPAGSLIEYRIRTTGDGSTPTITSGQLCTSFRIGQLQAGYCDELVSIGAATNRKIRMVLTCQSQGGSAQLYYYGQIRLFVEDMGALITQTGTSTPSVPSNYKTFDIQPYASRTWRQDGTPVLPFNNNLMQQGDLHDGAGHYRAWAWFDRTVTGGGNGGTLTDIVGVPLANVQKLWLYLYYDHWYYVDGYGGSPPHVLQLCTLGWHNQTAIPATEVPGGFPNVASYAWQGRNTGLWLDVKGTAVGTAILAGTFRGIMLGNSGSADWEQFGHCYGANGVGGRQPGLKAEYFK